MLIFLISCPTTIFKRLGASLLMGWILFSAAPGQSQTITPQVSKGDEVVTQFFLQPRKQVVFEERQGFLLLANRHLGLKFLHQGRNKFSLGRLYGVSARQDFISHVLTKGGPVLWRLSLRKDRGKDKKEIILTSMNEAQTSFGFHKDGSQGTLILSWKGLGVDREKKVLDVEVTVSLQAGDSLARWRLNVTNRSQIYGLWEVVFPVLDLAPVGGQPEDNFFVIGRSRGSLVRNPFRFQKRNVFGFFAEAGSFWPGNLNMQFQALYNRSGRGLYLATYDGNGYRKNFIFKPSPNQQSLRYQIVHLPQNLGYPHENYHMSYDVVMGPFSGDWYDAAHIYRQWALKQQWCQAGPLRNRKDIPTWYKKAPIVLLAKSIASEDRCLQLGDQLVQVLNFIGVDLPIDWYIWKKYFPKMTVYNKPSSPFRVPEARSYPVGNIHDGNYPALPALNNFAGTCQKLSRVGGHVSAYVCARIFDQGIGENAPFAKEAKPFVRRQVNGRLVLEDKNLSWGMCYFTNWWQQRLSQTVKDLITREHAGGIYFDTFTGGHFQCFNTSHGHSHGGGNDPYLGAKILAHVVRGAMKSTDPEAVMTGENPSETAINMLDGFLYRFTVWPDMVPLFATVYGDYIPRYGMTLNPESVGFYVQCATLFTEGAMMGRMPPTRSPVKGIKQIGTEETKKMSFLKKLASYRRPEVGGNFLIYGHLLRPLKVNITTSSKEVTYNEPFHRAYEGGLIKTSSLQSGVFQAPDGRLGIFLVNVTDKPITFNFQMTAPNYPLSAVPYDIVQIGPNGERLIKAHTNKPPITFTGKILGHDILFLSICN